LHSVSVIQIWCIYIAESKSLPASEKGKNAGYQNLRHLVPGSSFSWCETVLYGCSGVVFGFDCGFGLFGFRLEVLWVLDKIACM